MALIAFTVEELKVAFGRTFAVPGRCWKAGVVRNPAFHVVSGDSWITRVPAEEPLMCRL